MTNKEKAIVMAYTGKCMLTGDKFQIFHKYVEDIMGRPVYTHEMAIKAVDDEIKEKSKADFIALCAEDSSSEKPNKWIGAEVLDKIRAEIIKYEGDCRLSVDEYPSCKQCTDSTFETIYAILDKYKAESEG